MIRSMDPRKPNDQLPPLSSLPSVQTPAVLQECIAARAALAELKGAEMAIPDARVLMNGLAMREAQASWQIENIVTSGELLLLGLATGAESVDPATKEALRYVPAIQHGVSMLGRRGRFSRRMFLEVCRAIIGDIEDIRNGDQMIVLRNSVDGRVIYTPPRRVAAEALLNDLVKFANQADRNLDPLVRMAVMHYQFEAIHPFPDGNGRTGRVLNMLYLYAKGLVDQPILYLSQYFLRNRSDYYHLLNTVTTTGEWEGWIKFVLAGIKEVAEDALGRVRRIRELRSDFRERAYRLAPRASSETLLNLLFEWPYCTYERVQESEKVARSTAIARLHDLEQAGMLRSIRVGRRRLFVNSELLAILTD